jgi:DNA mismatch endonuclease (patch repair protein)
MKATRRQNTEAELKLRRELHHRGMRYRTHVQVLSDLRRQADIAFAGTRLAVFIDGCFWHGCPLHGTQARANAEYWNRKILQNQQRDRDTDERLRAAGWTALRVWEHQPVQEAATLVQETYERLAAARKVR